MHFNIDSLPLLKENVAIVLKGLNTYAEFRLNNELIFDDDTMFREWGVEYKDLVNRGSKKLEIKLWNISDEIIPKREEEPFRLLVYPGNDWVDVMVLIYFRKIQLHYS